MSEHSYDDGIYEMEDGTFAELKDGKWKKLKKHDVAALKKESSFSQEGPKPLNVGDNFARGLTREGLQGATLGFSDEIGLGLAAGPASIMSGNKYGDVYADMKKTYGGQQESFRQENPGYALAAEVAGGLMTGGVGAGRVAGTKFAKMHPFQAASGAGAGLGAASGAGYAPKMSDIPMMSGMGAIGGAVLGPLATKAGMAAGEILKGPSQFIAGGVTRSAETPDTGAARVMGHYLNADDFTSESMKQDLSSLGIEGMMADLPGANIRGLAQYVASAPGAGKQLASKAYIDRQSGSTKRLMKSLKELSGGDDEYFKNYQTIINRRKAEAAPLYESGKLARVNTMDSVFEEIKLIADDYEPSADILKKFYKGHGKDKRLKTSVKDLHSLQRELRDKTTKAYRDGEGELGSSYKEMRIKLMEAIDEASPDYKQARSIYAGESALLDAMESGKKILTTESDEVADMLQRLSQSERDAYINGAVRTLSNRLRSGREDANAASKLSTQIVRDKIRSAFPDEKSADDFIKALDLENTFAQAKGQIIHGSPTQPRLQTQADVGKVYKGGDILPEGRDAASVVMNKLRAIIGSDDIPEPVLESLSKMLFTKGSKRDALKFMSEYDISPSKASRIWRDVKKAIPGGLTQSSIGLTQSSIGLRE